jgi:hypothetical protein
MNVSPKLIENLKENEIFVFGSNTEGRHGAGAALQALQKFGASYGRGVGMVGQSYAIPTRKSVKHEGCWILVTLSVNEIGYYVDDFMNFTQVHKELNFLVTEIGCGFAGYKPSDIAPLFLKSANYKNVFLPQSFIDHLEKEKMVNA